MNEQKIGVVFGGSMGIGEATAKLLKEDGTRVTIVGRSKYPPAKPEALRCEPLKAAERGR
jgi:NAD(P)-dependent dehydrogenase (short-subunit alcohol dehydrogenase family)